MDYWQGSDALTALALTPRIPQAVRAYLFAWDSAFRACGWATDGYPQAMVQDAATDCAFWLDTWRALLARAPQVPTRRYKVVVVVSLGLTPTPPVS